MERRIYRDIDELPALCTMQETADFLRKSVPWMRLRIRNRDIKPLRTNHRGSSQILIKKAEIQRFIDACESRDATA